MKPLLLALCALTCNAATVGLETNPVGDFDVMWLTAAAVELTENEQPAC